MNKTNLIVDLSNLLWMIRFSTIKTKEPQSMVKELLMQETIKTIHNYATKFDAGGLLIACDSANYWRKDIYPEYKMNRSEEVDYYRDDVIGASKELLSFFNSCTNIPAIAVDRCEADDIIAVAKQLSVQKSIILSGDKDFVQLVDENTRLYSPVQAKERISENTKFDLFLKCIRGDAGDNITSAYPRVRKTKLEAAMDDPYIMSEIMESKFKRNGIDYRVGDIYERNDKLINLSRIPDNIVDSIVTEIFRRQKQSNYNQMKILKFFGENSLKEFAKEATRHTDFYKMAFHCV